MEHQGDPDARMRLALRKLMAVYQTSDIETLFIKAYEECIGGPKEYAIFDFRLHRDGQSNDMPAYIERACREHDVWPSTD